MTIVAFDIGGSFIKAGVPRGDGTVAMIGIRPTPSDDHAGFVAVLAAFLRDVRAGRPEAISLSIAGVVDPDTGLIHCANIRCIDNTPLADDLSRALGIAVHVSNDADCFALAEYGLGAGRGVRSVFGIILGTGVGGGLVIDGRLVRGAGGLSGEWGHGPVADRMPGGRAVPRFPCGCGQSGCIDTVGGARGLERLHRALHGGEAGSHGIIESWLAGDRPAADTVDCYVDLVSAALSLVVNTIGPNLVPVGGGLATVAPLIAKLDQATRGRILRRVTTPLVVPGVCVDNPGLIGAGLVARMVAGRQPDAAVAS